MSDPIRSSYPSRNASYPEDLTSREPDSEPQSAAVSKTPNASQPSTASVPSPSEEEGGDRQSVDQLMSRYPPPGPGVEYLPTSSDSPPRSAPPSPPAPAAGSGNTNADRVAETPLELGYTNSGSTPTLPYFGTAAVVYGRIPGTDISLEVGSVSAQGGGQSEAQAVLVRASYVGDEGRSLTVEALSAQSGVGIHNKDGSTGFNMSAQASVVAWEGTFGASGMTMTGGLSAGVGFEVSGGVRDIDKDGKDEVCVRIGAGIAVGGFCAEKP